MRGQHLTRKYETRDVVYEAADRNARVKLFLRSCKRSGKTWALRCARAAMQRHFLWIVNKSTPKRIKHHIRTRQKLPGK